MACRYSHTKRVTEWLYDFRDYCMPRHRDIVFHSSLQEHLVHENTELKMRNWINLYKDTILSSVDQYYKVATGRNPTQDPRRRQQARGRRCRSVPGAERPQRRWTPPAPSQQVMDSTTQQGLQAMQRSMRRWLVPGSRMSSDQPHTLTAGARTPESDARSTQTSRSADETEETGGLPKVKMKRSTEL
jgi:hypothetical protein